MKGLHVQDGPATGCVGPDWRLVLAWLAARRVAGHEAFFEDNDAGA